MVEKVSITPGSGADIGVDEVTINATPVLLERVKVALGADGAYQRDLQAGQATMDNSIPVVISSDYRFMKRVTVTPSNSTSIYQSGDDIGGKITLSNIARISGGQGIIKSLHLIERAQQKPTLYFHVFESDPTSATITDQSPITFSTNLTNVIRSFVVPGSAWFDDSGYAFADVEINLPFICVGSSNLYLAMSTPNTPTWGSSGIMTLDFMVEQW